MARKRGRQSLTLMIVPHSERPPIRLRIPIWVISVALALIATLLLASALFVAHHYLLARELEELRQERLVERSRQREMRTTILSQQEEVKNLSQEVEEFRYRLMEIDSLSHEIRQMLGLVEATPTPDASTRSHSTQGTPSSKPRADASPTPSSWLGREMTPQVDTAMGIGGRGEAPTPPSQSMALTSEVNHSLQDMRLMLPAQLEELKRLQTLVRERMAKINSAKRQDAAELERQLQLLAAAPHAWPVKKNKITSPFGYRKLQGRREFHTGVDIKAWYGTEVKATKDGKVIFAGWRPGYGWMVEIQHDMGYSTVYAHNSWYLVDAGDEVKEGDVIALSGSSGHSTGPHVHYEIRLYGVPLDPERFLD